MTWRSVERLLRGEPRALPTPAQCVAIGVTGGALHGLALGSSSGEPWLCVFAAIKVPLLLAGSTLVCLPSFYVVNAVLGLRDDFRAACRGLLAAQSTLGLALGATAPITAFLSASVLDPYALTLLAGLVFAAATAAGHLVLARHYRPLVARDRRHRAALRGWLLLYVFFAVQLAWVLRPFLGTEGFGVAFLRRTAFAQNAYVVLLDHAARLFR